MNRLEFRQIKQDPGIFETHTSGSTGTTVTVQKYHQQRINTIHASMLVERLHAIPPGNILKISPLYDVVSTQGNITTAPHYVPGDYVGLISFPSLFPDNLSQFQTVISYGERWTGVGIDLYSSEEFGTIAIQCPYNRNVLHIMPNLHIDFGEDGMRITDHDHPYLKEYEIGDVAHPTKCTCNLPLKAMTHVHGRIRNMMKIPDGRVIWPRFDQLTNRDLRRFQVVQPTADELVVHVDGTWDEDATKRMIASLGYPFRVTVVDGEFRPGKHEEFISLV